MDEFAASERARFPLFSSTAIVFLVGVFTRLDQSMDRSLRLRMTRLPSPEIMSSDEAHPASGLSRLATHTGVSFETVLNHIPRYHLGAVVLPVVSKNPSANLPLSETSLSWPASGWPEEMVSLVAVHVEVMMIRMEKSGKRVQAPGDMPK